MGKENLENHVVEGSAQSASLSSTAAPWSQMDSAPLDGTVVWIVVGGQPMIAFHQTTWNWKRFRVDRMWQVLWRTGDAELGPEPTNWMPLPEAPQAEGR